MHKRTSAIAAVLVAVTMVAPGAALAGAGDIPIAQPAAAADTKAPPALAEVKVTREQAIAAVKAIFPIPVEMGEPNVGLSQSQDGAAWELEWRTPSKQANPQSANARVDAVTGIVLSYSFGAAVENNELNYSRSEAYKLAAEWLDKAAADRKSALRYVDDPLQYGFWGGNTNFQFHWDRMEQGYPVTGDGIDIAIDARTGKLVSYNRSWRTNVAFDLPKTLLEQANAEKAYGDLPMQLIWRHYQKPGIDQGEWKLVYRPVGGYFPILSQDGKLVGHDGQPIDYSKLTYSELVPAADKPYVKPAKPISRDEALAMAVKLTGRKEAPTNADCREYGEETKTQTCNFSWYTEESGAHVGVDVLTGLISNFNNWTRPDPDTAKEKAPPKLTEADARKLAIEFIRTYRPDLAGNLRVQGAGVNDIKRPAGEPLTSYHISFTRLRDGIPYADGGASIEVDANTGAIQSFWSYMDERAEKDPFPPVVNTLKPVDAVAAFMKVQGLEQTWVTFYPQRVSPVKGGTADAKPITMLQWAPRRVMVVDAIDATGAIAYDYSGRNLIEAAKRPVDIDGHFAQKEIELLWARGIFELTDGKFRPAENATAAELARWLVMARGMQPYIAYDFATNFTAGGRGVAGANLAKSDAAPYFGAALQAGILLPEDFDPDADPNAPVSREMFALWAVRAMGYGDLIKMENRISMTFTDQAQIGAQYANAAAILNGLKIMRGDEAGRFNPTLMIDRGSAAKILFAVAARGRVYSYWK